jgi:Fe-S cluster assembly iron-binding protein IscA
MLQMTDRAADLLRNLRQEAKLPENTGVRVFSEVGASGEATVSIGFTPEPLPSDAVTEQAGMRLFVAPEIAAPLESAVMDVIAENGESQLIFRPAEDGGGASTPAES